MKQRIITLIALLCALAGRASATTKTYTVTGGNGNTQAEFYAQFTDGSTMSNQVNWTYNTTTEISFNLRTNLTLKLSSTAKQLVYNNDGIGGRGATTLTVSSSTYYIYRVRLLTADGNVIQLDANGNAVNHDGVSECDYWNMTNSSSHTFSNGILFSKIEVSYATAIPITDAVITGLSSQYPVSNAPVTPTPTVTWHGTTLTNGTHYSLTYQNNTAAGTATVSATGKGIFSSSTSKSANYTLVWATYSVRFNKNNGAATGTMSNQDFTYNTAQPLTANAFSREGYTFAGWNTAADGSGTSYSDGQEVQNLTATNGTTVDLYAQWTPITYTLRLHHNDGTEAYTDMTMTYDQAQNIQSISRTCYTFDGWSTAPDGDVVYTDQQEVLNLTATNGATVDLYAQWAPITYSITYDLAGGTVATANPASYTIESNNFTLANPTRTGYTFAGWTGTGLNEPAMEVTIPTGSTEHRSYTATWTAHTYSVHFDKNSDGATGTIADQAFTYGVSHQLSANAFTAPFGYQFYRWTTNADGSGTAYTDGQSVQNLTATDGATVDLYAQWEVIPWSGTGGSGDPYVISYPSQLDLLATRVNSGNSYSGEFFKLGADIAYDPTALDANGENYTAIGNINTRFQGTFDGDGHTVSGIRINKTGSTDADRKHGLFGYIGYNGTVQNVILNDAHITGFNQVGGITGDMSFASIKNCLVLNTAIVADGNSSNVGVISGIYSGTFTANYYHNCTLTKGGTTRTINIGIQSADRDGARSVHALTLPDGVSATGERVAIDGTTYYASNTTVTLSPPIGYILTDVIVNGTPATDNGDDTWSFTMPAADATVTATATSTIGEYVPIAELDDGSTTTTYGIDGTNTTAEAALRAALDDAANASGSTVTLFQDVTLATDGIECMEGTYTLDLNGHSIAGSGEIFEVGGATMTIIDGSSAKTGNITNTGSYAAIVINAGSFNCTGCTISSNITTGTGFEYNGGTFTLTDCTITGNTAISFNVGGVHTLTNCTIIGTSYGILISSSPSLTLDGCTITGNVGIAYEDDHQKTISFIGNTIKDCAFAGILISNNVKFRGLPSFGTGSDANGCDIVFVYDSTIEFQRPGIEYYVPASPITVKAVIWDSYAEAYVDMEVGPGLDSYTFAPHCDYIRYPNTSNAIPIEEVFVSANPDYIVRKSLYSQANAAQLTKPVVLTDDVDNASTINTYIGEDCAVPLQGRTLYKDGDWNTLCVPFNTKNITTTTLAGAEIRSLESASLSTDGTLTLNFSEPVNSLNAGTPYIIKWTPAQAENLVNPLFPSVLFSDADTTNDFTSEDGKVQFKGTYAPITFTPGDKSILFLGAENTLYYPESGASINAFRAYFQLNDPSAQVKAFIFNFGDEATAVTTPLASGIKVSGEAWYDINGRRLNGKPAQKGLYIVNGRKVAIK